MLHPIRRLKVWKPHRGATCRHFGHDIEVAIAVPVDRVVL
jgi:hypothetical protein